MTVLSGLVVAVVVALAWVVAVLVVHGGYDRDDNEPLIESKRRAWK